MKKQEVQDKILDRMKETLNPNLCTYSKDDASKIIKRLAKAYALLEGK